MAITIEMPRLSDSMHEGIVLRWVKKIGDFVEVGDHLADIETDKAHVELQACEDGTLMEILVPEGGSAAVGAPIALLQSEFGAASCDCPPCPPVKCSPLAARLAAEAGLNAGTLRGTGPRGKIMAADVRASIRPADGPARRVQTPLAPRDTRHATRVDNFYLYSLEANMAYLAAISTPIAFTIGVSEFTLQTGLFDQILPGLLPLAFTMVTFWLVQKNWKPNKILLLIFLFGLVTGTIGIFA